MFNFRNKETRPNINDQQYGISSTGFTDQIYPEALDGIPISEGWRLNKTEFLFARKQRKMAIRHAIVPATYDLIQ